MEPPGKDTFQTIRLPEGCAVPTRFPAVIHSVMGFDEAAVFALFLLLSETPHSYLCN